MTPDASEVSLRVELVLLASVLLLPVAWATPTQGSLTMEDMTLAGYGVWEIHAAIIDLRPAVAGGQAIALPLDEAEGTIETVVWENIYPTRQVAESKTTSWSTRGSRLVIDRCGPSCELVLFAEDPSETFLFSNATFMPSPTSEPRVYSAVAMQTGVADDRPRIGFYREIPPGRFSISGSPRNDSMVANDLAIAMRGEYTLFGYDVAGRVESPQGVAPFDHLSRREALREGVPPTEYAHKEIEDTILLRIVASAGEPMPMAGEALFESSEVAMDGSLEATAARGELSSGPTRVQLLGEPLALTGVFTVAFSPPPEGEPTEATVQGDVATLLLAGQGVPLERGTSAPLAFAAVLAIALALIRPLWLPLYSRISRGQALDNPTRLRVLEEVRARPGIGVPAVARGLGIARAVVLHHLAILEGHRLVVARRVGWERQYFLPEAAPTPAQLVVAKALADPTRRRVAEAVKQGLDTQAAITEATGIGQRLVSYHLTRLEKAGLVAVEAGRPQRYVPGGPLATALP